jgi:hypothetical protein
MVLKLFLSLFVMLTFLGMTLGLSSGEEAFKAVLTGSEEVVPVRTGAKGEVTFHLKGENELIFTLTVTDIDDVTAIHIHEGKKGENGPPVANLFAGPKKEGLLSDLLAQGQIRAYELTGPLKGKSLQSLIQLMRAGNAYVNVHTAKNPEGEIRGQIQLAEK